MIEVEITSIIRTHTRDVVIQVWFIEVSVVKHIYLY